MYDIRTSEGRDQLVSENWVVLAFAAYHAYLSQGRGAVIVQGDKSAPYDELPGYLPLDAVRDNNESELGQLVEEYDPERQIVCAFERGDFIIAFGRYEARTPTNVPASVYRAVRKKTQARQN